MRKRRADNWFGKAAGFIEDFFFEFVVQFIGEFVIDIIGEIIC